MVSTPSRRIDRGGKRLAYEEFGGPASWILDPATRSGTVLQLAGGTYVEPAVVTGGDPLTVALPFPVTLPCALFDP